MADIVEISAATYIPGINQIGDIVDVYDDGIIDPNSQGYKNFNIRSLPGFTKAEVQIIIDSRLPSIQNKMYWQDQNSDWIEVKKIPKYATNISNLSAEDLMALSGTEASKETKQNILNTIQENITSQPENNETKLTTEAK